MGYHHGYYLFGSSSLSWTESRTSIRSRHSDCHHRRRGVKRHQAERRLGRKRHHPVHRCLLGRDCSGSHLYPACPLHSSGKISGNDRQLHADVHQLPAGWCIGHPLPDSIPEIFRQGKARRIPLPGSDRGEKGGDQAKPLLLAGLVGGLYDFIVGTLGWWNENFTSRVCGWGEALADKFKLVFKINTGAAVLGLGYIVGLKYAAIICAGSIAVWLIIVPGLSLIWGDQVLNAWNPDITLAVKDMTPEQIFSEYAKSIGIGGIAMAGIIGIVRSWDIIKSAVSLAGKEMGGKKVTETTERTQKDLSMKFIAFGSIFTLLLILAFFYFDVMQGDVMHTVVAILLVAVISFLFTTVAANAIAIVGTNPVSGMTLMTLILASVIMVAVGLKGTTGMVAALVMGGVVCTALSMAGGFITDLKIGYWLGSTPKKQESWKFLGTLVSAATVGGVIMILNDSYGFTSGQLAAPQANAMAAVIDPLMNGVGAPWLLYGIGAMLALVLTFCKVPALAFALGMFIPLELNLPLLVGGAINWYVTTRSKDEAVNSARGEKGTLLASGFIAGGALMGVVSAILRYCNVNVINDSWLNDPMSQVVSLVAYICLIVFLVKASMKIKKGV